MQQTTSFGYWVRRQRKALDLTQRELARRAGCAPVTIRKIEADERRPSRQLAHLLAEQLAIPLAEQSLFIQCAVGERSPQRLAVPEQLAPQATATARPPTNLPAPVTPLVGRKQEIAALTALLRREHVRLVTVTGPGGVGKTRLALHVAASLVDEFAHGIFLVSLAAVRESDQIVSAIAQALDVRESGSRPLLEIVKSTLSAGPLLLILDNFEHLTAAAPLVAHCLSAAPHLKIVATSRESLHLQGEHEFPTLPLSLPAPQQQHSFAEIVRAEAVQLFQQRALAVQPNLVLDDANAPAVAEICTRLDGLPLAIELAAARVKLFSPQALLQRLVGSGRLTTSPVLRGGQHDRPQRHQTLNQAISWSYDLLAAPEQALFRRLAIFVGGCTQDAVAAVCNAAGDLAPDLEGSLGSLVDKSLVQQTPQRNGEPRFTMLETIRAFGLEQMDELGETPVVRDAHALYFVELAEQAAQAWHGPQQMAWFDRLTAEVDNLNAVFHYLLTTRQTGSGLRFGGALWHFWHARAQLAEGRQRLSYLLALPDAEQYGRPYAAVLVGAGLLAERHGDIAQSIQLLDASLVVAEQVGDNHLVALALSELGQAARAQGDYTRAQRHHEGALAAARATGDKALIARSLDFLAKTLDFQGHSDQALPLLEESQRLAREIDDKPTLCLALFYLGFLARLRQDIASAERLFSECLALAEQTGNKVVTTYVVAEFAMIAVGRGDFATARQSLRQSLRTFVEIEHRWGAIQCLEFSAILAATEQQHQRAHLLAGAATGSRRATNSAGSPHTARLLKTALHASTGHLTRAEAIQAEMAGQRMTFEEAVALVLQRDGPLT